MSIAKVIVWTYCQYQVSVPEKDFCEICRNSRDSNTCIQVLIERNFIGFSLTLERGLLSSTFNKFCNFFYTGEHRASNYFTRFSEVNFALDQNSRMYEILRKNN